MIASQNFIWIISIFKNKSHDFLTQKSMRESDKSDKSIMPQLYEYNKMKPITLHNNFNIKRRKEKLCNEHGSLSLVRGLIGNHIAWESWDV